MVFFGVGMLVATGGFIGGLAGAGVFSSSSSPVDQSRSKALSNTLTVTVTPNAPSQLISPDGNVAIYLPAGSVDRPLRLVYRQMTLDQMPPLPSGFLPTEKLFYLSVAAGQELISRPASLANNITVIVSLSGTDIARSAGIAANLTIQSYIADAGWIPLPTEVDFATSTAGVQVDALSMFALTIRRQESEADPALITGTTKVPSPTSAASPTSTSAKPTTTPPSASGAAVAGPTSAPELPSISSSTPESTGKGLPTPTEASISVPTPVGTATALPTPTPTQLPIPEPTPAPSYLLAATVEREGFGKIGLIPASDDFRYAAGTLVRVTVSCDFGFLGWKGNLPDEVEPSSKSIILTMDQPRTLIGNCGVQPLPSSSYSLTVNSQNLKQGQLMLFVVNGTIRLSQSPGPNGEFKAGSNVGLLAMPDRAGFVVSWSGVDSASDVFATVEMNRDRQVEVSIVQPTYIVTASPDPSEGGGVLGGGEYLSGARVILRAAPHIGWNFNRWTGDCSGHRDCFLIVDSHKSVIAIFRREVAYTLSTRARPANGGTVSPSSTSDHEKGSAVTVVATPAVGFAFYSWSGDCGGLGPCNLIMNEDKNVTAWFRELSTAPTTTREPRDGSPIEPTPTPTPPPPSERIAFSTDRDGNAEIYVMNPDGSNPARLTTHPAIDVSPVWSANGEILAFATNRDGDYEIYPMTASGSNPANLTNHPADDQHPAWSWANNRIAFATQRDSNMEVYVMDSDGNNQTNLTSDPSLDVDPDWSADGTRIAFRSSRDGNDEIYVMNVDGTNQTNVTNRLAHDAAPAWSPDGSKAAFHATKNGNDEIYVMDSDGSNLIRLTNNPAEDVNPAWSPDGAKIAFESDRDGNKEIYVMNADGISQINITNHAAHDEDPSWGP